MSFPSSSSLPPYSPPEGETLTRAQSTAIAKGLPFPNSFHDDNQSAYTLRSIPRDSDELSTVSTLDATTPLRSATGQHYGSTSPALPPLSPGVPSSRRLLLNASIKMAVLFVISCIILGGTLWLALPTLDEADRAHLHIPKSFDELQQLNTLLKKYRDIYPYRIVICYLITYLFLQAFSLPGSMYLSILAGAVWGMARAIPLACTAVATGATLCYLISAALGPALLVVPKWADRLERWKVRVDDQRANLLSFLIVIRIAPFPPHWVVNVICPHVGIGIPMFWISTWFGILGVTIIHTTIGGGLDEMTSAADFHLISWRNFFGLAIIVVAVLIPVGLRYVWKKELQVVAQTEAEIEGTDDIESQNPLLGYVDEDEDDDASDVILQTGPAAINKGKQVAAVLGDRVAADARLVLIQDDEAETEQDLLLESEGSDEDDEVLAKK
ncbi:hypothetical protein M422DRAFT_26217 [Sphaerobolus stellatus SS14]|nr:hypothetical protein M422DRAFT_26217 [Sphaerobolus stellatus SS14]